MYFVLALLFDFATIEGLITRIPEAAGLMAFGVILIVGAGLLRWALRTKEDRKTDKQMRDSIS
jgi:Flp pilus assembly protein TadB